MIYYFWIKIKRQNVRNKREKHRNEGKELIGDVKKSELLFY